MTNLLLLCPSARASVRSTCRKSNILTAFSIVGERSIRTSANFGRSRRCGVGVCVGRNGRCSKVEGFEPAVDGFQWARCACTGAMCDSPTVLNRSFRLTCRAAGDAKEKKHKRKPTPGRPTGRQEAGGRSAMTRASRNSQLSQESALSRLHCSPQTLWSYERPRPTLRRRLDTVL